MLEGNKSYHFGQKTRADKDVEDKIKDMLKKQDQLGVPGILVGLDEPQSEAKEDLKDEYEYHASENDVNANRRIMYENIDPRIEAVEHYLIPDKKHWLEVKKVELNKIQKEINFNKEGLGSLKLKFNLQDSDSLKNAAHIINLRLQKLEENKSALEKEMLETENEIIKLENEMNS